MNPILIFQHVDCEGPGYLGDFLARHGVPYRVVRIDQGAAVPESLYGSGGLAFMGGPMSVNDRLPWIERELALIRQACAARLPVLGHCLGGQLIAAALGARVTRNPVREIGWHEVARAGDADLMADGESYLDGARLLERLPERFEAFHWHGETFAVPAGAALLLQSEHCAHQAFVYRSALALQFHVEVTAGMVADWAQAYRGELEDAGALPSVQPAATMTTELAARVNRLHRIADAFYEYWLDQVETAE